MPIRCRCPGCKTPYELAEQLAGKKVRCKKCQTSFAVPAPARAKEEPPLVEEIEEVLDAELAAPEDGVQTSPRTRRPATPPRAGDRRRPDERTDRPRGRRNDEDDYDRHDGEGTPVGLIVGIVAGVMVLLLIGLGLGLWLFLKPSPAPAPVVAAKDLPVGQAPQFQPPQFQPPPQPKPPLGPPPGPAAPPPVAVTWKVRPDPLKDAPAEPAGPLPAIPVGGFQSKVLFPSSPSPFVAVSRTGPPQETLEVWNLQTSKRVGTVILGNIHNDEVLSPDGAYLASKPLGPKATIEVFSVADGRSVKIDVEDKIVHLYPSDFAGSGRLLTAKGVLGEVLFQVWDIQTGKAVCQFQVAAHPDAKARTFSPGRKYLAFPHRDGKKVLVYDLTSGEPAGEAVSPADFGFVHYRALAFSPDGKTLAGLAQAGAKAQFITWDVTTGQPTVHDLDQDPQFQAQNALGYDGLPLEWLPSGTALLAYGQLLLDAQTGKVIWTLPREALDSSPRRVIAGRTLACVKGDNRAKALVLEALPKDRIDTAAQAVREGKDPAATVLPPATPADWSAARNLPPPAGAAPWKAAPDPAPAAKGKLAAQPIPLKGHSSDLQAILFSRPDVAQAAVLTAAAADNVSPRKQVRVDRYDVAGGQLLGGADLFAVEMPKGKPLNLIADLSPDGARLAIAEPRDERRVDVFSLADGKHVAGWLPYEKEADPKVRWVGFLDGGKVLTLGTGGKLVLWSVPECKALWSAAVRDLVALSPGRKLLAAHNGATYEILDAASGDRLGQLGGPRVQNVLAAAFRGDGQELVAVVRADDPAQVLVRWDLKTGKDAPAFPVLAGGTDLSWAVPGFVLYNGTLIDTELKWPLGRYTLSGTGRLATGSPDGRLWFAVGQGPMVPPVLTAQTLPDQATQTLARQIAARTVRPVLAPGMTVAVQVNVQAPRNADALRQRVFDGLAGRLKMNGLKVAAGAGDLRLVVQMGPERPTGQTMQLKELGKGFGTINVPIQEVACRAVLTDSRGTPVWEQKQQFRTPDFFGVLRTDDPVADLDNALWNNCANWALPLPAILVRTPQGLEALPRIVPLKGDR